MRGCFENRKGLEGGEKEELERDMRIERDRRGKICEVLERLEADDGERLSTTICRPFYRSCNNRSFLISQFQKLLCTQSVMTHLFFNTFHVL